MLGGRSLGAWDDEQMAVQGGSSTPLAIEDTKLHACKESHGKDQFSAGRPWRLMRIEINDAGPKLPQSLGPGRTRPYGISEETAEEMRLARGIQDVSPYRRHTARTSAVLAIVSRVTQYRAGCGGVCGLINPQLSLRRRDARPGGGDTSKIRRCESRRYHLGYTTYRWIQQRCPCLRCQIHTHDQ